MNINIRIVYRIQLTTKYKMQGSRFSQCKSIYVNLLPLFVSSTTLFGLIVGMTATPYYRDNKAKDSFMNIVGYTGIGIITGLLFPITYPLIGAYVLYKNRWIYEMEWLRRIIENLV
jgi:hypothetical protein